MGTNVPKLTIWEQYVPFTDRNSEHNSPICPIVQPSVPHIYYILLIQSLFADATKKIEIPSVTCLTLTQLIVSLTP